MSARRHQVQGVRPTLQQVYWFWRERLVKLEFDRNSPTGTVADSREGLTSTRCRGSSPSELQFLAVAIEEPVY